MTLVVEAASASSADDDDDRCCHLRVVLGEIIHGVEEDWKNICSTVPGRMVHDCRSLVDHVRASGGTVAETRVGMEIADLREGIGEEVVTIGPGPTEAMPADGLTKHLPEQLACSGSRWRAR